MSEATPHRRLAAILAADVAGYSRLVNIDEDGTLASFRSHLVEFLEPTIASSNGRLFKTMGDGLLAEFASVVDAVKCAVAIQNGMQERNAGLDADRRIDFRIGINLGDVVVENDDVFGDGVNVAARLEGLAEPGGICISRSARDQVRDRLQYGLEDWGEVEVKNIPRPVRVFRVLPDEADAGRIVAGKARSMWPNLRILALALLAVIITAGSVVWWQGWLTGGQVELADRMPDRPSVAVLPFDSLSQDTDQEYFADGITEDIIVGLSKISGLFVIARNSTFEYKGKAVEPGRIADELGVRHLLTGSVRRAADRLRITVNLVDALKGNTLWAEQYDRQVSDVFAVQSEIGGQVVKALSVTLRANEQERLYRTHTDSIPAYELFLKARKTHLITSRANVMQAAELYRKVVQIDPDFAGGYAGLSFLLSLELRFGRSTNPSADKQQALELARKAVSIDPEFGWGHIALGSAYIAHGDPDAAVTAVQRAVDLQPNDADALLFMGYYKAFAGISGVDDIKASLRLDPKPTNRQFFFLGCAYYVDARYDDAVRAFEKWDELSPINANLPLLAASYAMAGMADKAEATARRLREATADFDSSSWKFLKNFKRAETRARFVEGMQKAGLP